MPPADRRVGWRTVFDEAVRRVPDRSVDALWRALNYLCVAQLYLADNVRLERPLLPSDVKATPCGHWGTCPPVNLVLANLAPLLRHAPATFDLRIVHGGGHAGPSALGFGYLTGQLGRRWPQFRHGRSGLWRLVTEFPHQNTIGSEITPMIPPHIYMGGQLGPALAFAQGTVLDAPHRLAVALIGDGECETGATAAAWLGGRAIDDTGGHGSVLPVVLLNGLRMGGRSLLGRLGADQQVGYFTGLGHRPLMVDDPGELRAALGTALRLLDTRRGAPPVLVVRLAKGATGPVAVGGRRIMGTPAVHKAPLRAPRSSSEEFQVLAEWLAGYRPDELITADGVPTDLVREALPDDAAVVPPVRGRAAPPGLGPTAGVVAAEGIAADGVAAEFGPAVAAVLTRHGRAGGFRVFSPDELLSNRIPLGSDGTPPSWVTEVLNEELCHLWLQGYLETGRRGALVTYEAFAPVNTSLIQQYLKYRAVARAAGRSPVASLTYLITSLGWHNCYSHQNPGLVSALLDVLDATVRVTTPADPARTAVTLDRMLSGTDRCNLLIASKHPLGSHPVDTLDEEIEVGAAIWPWLSDPGPPNLVLAGAGDLPARQLTAAVPRIRAAFPGLRLRYVHVHELTALGDPRILPHALSERDAAERFGDTGPVVLAVPGHAGAVNGLVAGRRELAGRVTVRGFRDPGRPMAHPDLVRHCGLDPESLVALAGQLLGKESRHEVPAR